MKAAGQDFSFELFFFTDHIDLFFSFISDLDANRFDLVQVHMREVSFTEIEVEHFASGKVCIFHQINGLVCSKDTMFAFEVGTGYLHLLDGDGEDLILSEVHDLQFGSRCLLVVWTEMTEEIFVELIPGCVFVFAESLGFAAAFDNAAGVDNVKGFYAGLRCCGYAEEQQAENTEGFHGFHGLG